MRVVPETAYFSYRPQPILFSTQPPKSDFLLFHLDLNMQIKYPVHSAAGRGVGVKAL